VKMVRIQVLSIDYHAIPREIGTSSTNKHDTTNENDQPNRLPPVNYNGDKKGKVLHS
jgi:hypothetical protein